MTDDRQKLGTISRQRGATLLLSLTILMILTVLGISAMNNSGMQANLAHNFQMGNTDFQLAETTIETLLFRASMGTFNTPLSTYNAANDIIRMVDTTADGNSLPFTMDSADATTPDPDPDDYLGPGSNVRTDATVTFDYDLNTQMCPGGAGTGQCNLYTIDANTSLDGTLEGPHHFQQVSVLVPEQ